jgi:hypothetical protein
MRIVGIPMCVILVLLAGCGAVGSSPVGASPSSRATIQQSSPSVEASASASLRSAEEFVVAAIPLDYQAGSVAVSGDWVWVIPHLDPVVLRIDPATNAVVGTIQLEGGGPPAEIDADEEMVWASVSTAGYDPDHLVGIDSNSSEIVASADVPGVFPQIGGDHVWAAGPEGFFKIDRRSGELVATVGVRNCRHLALERWVWCSGGGSAYLIDPTTDAITSVDTDIPLGPPVEAIGSVVWGISPSGDRLWTYDINAGEVTVDLVIPEEAGWFMPDAAVLDETLWVVAQGGTRWWLVPIDTVSRAFGQPINVANPEFGIAAGHGALWIPVIREPTVLRVEPPR